MTSVHNWEKWHHQRYQKQVSENGRKGKTRIWCSLIVTAMALYEGGVSAGTAATFDNNYLMLTLSVTQYQSIYEQIKQ